MIVGWHWANGQMPTPRFFPRTEIIQLFVPHRKRRGKIKIVRNTTPTKKKKKKQEKMPKKILRPGNNIVLRTYGLYRWIYIPHGNGFLPPPASPLPYAHNFRLVFIKIFFSNFFSVICFFPLWNHMLTYSLSTIKDPKKMQKKKTENL